MYWLRSVVVLAATFFFFSNGFEAPQKDKTISSLTKKLSGFISSKQYDKVLSKIEDEFWNLTSADDILSGLVSKVLGVLTPTQSMTLLQNGAAMSKQSGVSVDELLDRIGDVLYNNMYEVVSQMLNVTESLQARKKMKKSSVLVVLYRKMNQFATFTRMETIMCRLVARFTEKEWEGVRDNAKNLVRLMLYPCASGQ